jgi:uncharacterized membrane protein YdbT with pleckstrin-like domain
MTESAQSMDLDRELVDKAIPLGDDEGVLWVGRPRWTVVVPAVVVGTVFVVLGLVIGIAGESLSGLVLVPIGAATAIARVLQNRKTQYLVTDRALYRKTGVLSRRVTRADLATVQNSAYAQGVTGSLFGYGTVTFEIAGGIDLAFDTIENPDDVRALVDQETGTDSLAGDSTESATRRTGVPGRLDQWQAVREEVGALRRVVEQRR